MTTIRASEIGSYLYCARAWWYQRKGVASTNQAELAGGEKLHQQHSRQALFASLIRGLAMLCLLVGLSLLAAQCTLGLL